MRVVVHGRPGTGAMDASKTRTLFSIIVPTYNRPRQLRALLEALTKLDYPQAQYEVLIVDDGSPEPPIDLVQEFSSRIPVTLLTKPHAGPAAARNTGAAQARGDYLCFTDDDCAPGPDWLRRLEPRVHSLPNCGVGGQIINTLGSDPYSTASHDLVEYLFEYYNRPAEVARFFTTNNLTLPRHLFRALGGFDTSFTLAAAEDRDLCDRWRERGWDLRFAPDVVVSHAHAMNLLGFWRQHYRYGRGAVYLHAARERRGLHKPRLEPISFYLGLLAYPSRRGHGLRTPAIMALMALSQMAYAAGYYLERPRVKPIRPRVVKAPDSPVSVKAIDVEAGGKPAKDRASGIGSEHRD